MKFREFHIRLVIHLHAMLRQPKAYLIASYWRLCGKRLRARAHFAPLLSASPRAYALWLLNETSDPEPCGESLAPIIALIDVAAGYENYGQTLGSLAAEGVEGFLIGSDSEHDLKYARARIDWTAEPWLMPMVGGDLLSHNAAKIYRAAVLRTDSSLIYADDDLLDKSGSRIEPHFKPRWNSELFKHFDYLSGSCIVRSRFEDHVSSAGGDWKELMVERLATTTKPYHIPQVLHHRVGRPEPRKLLNLNVVLDLPLVTIIIPTRNRVDLLIKCLSGVLNTEYPKIEIIVVDNDSDDTETVKYLKNISGNLCRVIHFPGPFNFSALNNAAAKVARGDLLCLLNNDIEIRQRDWLEILVTQALRPDIGAVGAQLLYPDGRIQHAGVVLGIGGGAAHAHRLLQPSDAGYFRRHALPQFVSAVTAACLVVQRERFLAVAGFDEINFPVAFNDVDLCMRLNERGWRSLYEPRAVLVHHESLSRGQDRDVAGAARLARELAALQKKWGNEMKADPYHHPQLSRFSERFVVRL